eukprot:1477466-Pleurochrysis_carterae.AAC.1
MDAAQQRARSDGAVRIDCAWKRTLETELERTPVPATLSEAVRPMMHSVANADLAHLADIIDMQTAVWR